MGDPARANELDGFLNGGRIRRGLTAVGRRHSQWPVVVAPALIVIAASSWKADGDTACTTSIGARLQCGLGRMSGVDRATGTEVAMVLASALVVGLLLGRVVGRRWVRVIQILPLAASEPSGCAHCCMPRSRSAPLTSGSSHQDDPSTSGVKRMSLRRSR